MEEKTVNEPKFVVHIPTVGYRTEAQMLSEFPYLKSMSAYNAFPEPWREVDEHFYRHYVHMQCIEMKMFVQIIIDDVYTNVDIYFYPHYALAVAYPSKWDMATTQFCDLTYVKPLRYYHIGCDHQWDGVFSEEQMKMLPKGRCMHSSKCSKCGIIRTVDSSD